MTEHVANTFPGKNGGRLQRGNLKGRPPVKREAIEAIRKGLPEVIEKLVKKAQGGDAKSIELCLHYGIGKPTDKVELSGPDGGPIEHTEATLNDHEKRLLRDAVAALDTAGADTADTTA